MWASKNGHTISANSDMLTMMKIQACSKLLLLQCTCAHLRGEFKDVSDELHGELWGVDVRVANHELLQNVILNGPM